MGDVPVRQCEFDWQIKPPETVKQGHTLTIVGRIPARVEIHVLEAIILKDSGEHGERFEGDGTYTGPGFNDDGVESTYVWFYIKLDDRGKNKIKFRITWRRGRDLWGAVETFEVIAGDAYDSQFYSTEERDLLSLLFNW
ncbi:hypothetical protein F5Y12DRAFT_714653 [Xylaria sp. FL1777]|nr:hypothetical protein F5Y12DRAFT_714653 [Xylaria sp. FL1777]